MFRKNCLVMAALLHRSHSSCHFSVASSSSSLYRVVLGILLKTTGISLLLAPSLAKRSASLLPKLPAWTLIHENSIIHLVLLRLVNFFLISSTG